MSLRFFMLTALNVILVSCNKHDNEIEVKADISMNPQLMKQLKQSLEDELELGYFRGNADSDRPLMEMIKDNALHELLKEDLPEIVSEGNPLLAKIYTYEERAQKKGKDSLQAIADHVKTKLKLSDIDLTSVVKKITTDYLGILKRYFSDLAREKPDSHVDAEYLILDMVNVVPLIRGNIEKKLLNNIISLAQESQDVSDEDIEIFISTLVTFNDNDKQQEMDFMCAMFKVCRPNPTFSNYLYKLLEEVLKLNNAKFHYFLNKCSQLLLNKQSLFEAVLRDDIVELFRKKMKNMATANVTEMRESVSFLHSIVTRRYKINTTNNKKLQTKAKSAYIILDIVDTAFGIDGKDIYGTQFDKTISSVEEWSELIRNDIDVTLFDFIQYVIEALNYNLTQRAREEIKALADIIFRDVHGKQNGTEYLLTEGSKFVKGLINRPEPKILF